MPILLQMSRWCVWPAIALFAIGFVSRVLPLFDPEARLLEQFPTEDGYLMLTMARNIALGLGMSTAEGTIPTNGTQPFTTFTWAIGYFFTSGDKTLGIYFSHLLQLAASVLCALVLYQLGTRVLRSYKHGKEAALIMSACFFCSPHILPHTMNFLETGFYILGITIVMSIFYEEEREQLWSLKKCIGVGLLLGILFWIRIDSVFLILAACLSYLYQGTPQGLNHVKQRFLRTLIFGSTSVLVASPWLINNYLNFGAIMPISGPAQAPEQLGQNLTIIPSILFEYLSIIMPIPNSMQENPFAVFIGIATILIALIATVQILRTSNYANRGLVSMGAIFIVCLVSYYGIFFGAKHFVARYLGAAAPFLALLTTCSIVYMVTRFNIYKFSLKLCSVLIILLVSALQIRIYLNGIPHQHFQVVNWVNENVPKDVWVGAVQTGTLGYYHDRTINLDGKVNPEALSAKQGKAFCPIDEVESNRSCVPDYVVDRGISYVVDWAGVGSWIDLSPMDEHFELIVHDQHANLAVLRRKGAPQFDSQDL